MSSIQRYLTVRLCLLAAILLPCGVLAVYLLARQLLVSQLDSVLAAKAEALISMAEVDGNEIEFDTDILQFAGFGSALSGDFFEVRDSAGEVIARSPSLENEPAELARERLPGEWRADVDLPDGNPGRAAAFLFRPEGNPSEQLKELQLVVAIGSGQTRQVLRTLLVVLMSTGAAGLVAAVILIRTGLSKGLSPLNQLASNVERLKVGEPGLRLETERLPNELQGIGEKLNALLQRVETSIERERRFSSHAAHELRTPLAELKMMAELVGKWPEEATPEQSKEMLAVILELEGLIERLSLIARAEAGNYLLQIEDVDLKGSIDRAVAREAAESEEKGLRIQVNVEPGRFRSDPVLWQTILRNLLGNAFAYSPANSVIRVQASPSLLLVSNPARDLQGDDLEFLFERFWRKNTARDGREHSGLGLAIVQTAVELLGGTCRATLENGILTLTIQWDRKRA